MGYRSSLTYEIRRSSAGLDGFRLTYGGVMDYQNASAPMLGYHFPDAVALSNAYVHAYFLTTCKYPPYMTNGNQTKLFWVPFRALTVESVGNLLLAGKTISQSAHANDATRKHPTEWSTGVAAGGAAVMMVRQQWTARSALLNIKQLQDFLNSSVVGQPLEWQV
eukprot:NODE_3021_length_1293_cov_15.050427_g2867_i0.p1 GENE.NODE_3021_length_1293_cov_15.050427_g2867_i0~~NODE_3021_length_1293_cov_15.050427_g2867_i0.p1  ORF type:complete len:164 (+),score=21.04 NODE_3021_length_1293_cov_15.050427_g2867_i0:758-1249(+)